MKTLFLEGEGNLHWRIFSPLSFRESGKKGGRGREIEREKETLM